MFDAAWEQQFLAKVKEAAFQGTLEAQAVISNSPVNEKQELRTKEVLREYEISERQLSRMRLETLELRKNKDWTQKNGRIIYFRKALEEKLARRWKDNGRNIKLVA